jgi:hypothetical protein
MLSIASLGDSTLLPNDILATEQQLGASQFGEVLRCTVMLPGGAGKARPQRAIVKYLRSDLTAELGDLFIRETMRLRVRMSVIE